MMEKKPGDKTLGVRTGKDILNLFKSKEKKGSGPAIVSPRDELETNLFTIWSSLLGHEAFGIHDDFFKIGGNSLKGIQVVSRIAKNSNVTIQPTDIFLHPTIAELASFLKAKQHNVASYPEAVIQPRPELIPLSFGQERLWFIHQLEGSSQYNVPAVLRVEGALNIDALNHALQTIVNRHESLRTIIVEQQGHPWQFIKEKDALQLETIDGSSFQTDDRKLHEQIDKLINRPFDLSKDHMIRVTLVRLTEQKNIIVFVVNHIASDAWSLSILVNEVMELYASYVEGREAFLQDLDVQYADYSIWQRSSLNPENLEKRLDYWREKLEGVAPLELPTDFIRPAVISTHGASTTFGIEKDLSADIRRLGEQTGSSLFMVLLSAFKVLLHHYSGQSDISVGTSIATRPRHEFEALIGFFVNTLALRTEVDRDSSFIDLLQQVKVTMIGAYEYQDVPFEKVVDSVTRERNPGRTPLFQVMMVLHNTPQIPTLRLGEVQLSYEPFDQQISKFDITFFITDTPEGLQCNVEYNTDLYREDTIVRMTEHFRQLLFSIVQSPTAKIGAFSLLTKKEKTDILNFGSSQLEYPKTKTIVSLFEEQVAKTPDDIAVVFEQQVITYRGLNERANQLAHYLRDRGIKQDTLVPLCIERSPAMIIAMLGILKSGAAYVPLEPDFPEDRKSFVFEDSNATVIVSSTESSATLPGLESVHIIEIDDQFSGVRSQPVDNPNVAVTPNQLAYVIYTSGSTGKPKGVMIEHRSLVDYVFGLNQALQVDNCKSYALVSSIATDLGNTVIYSSWVFGGALHIFSKESVTDSHYIHNYFRDNKIDCLKIVPSHWKALSIGEDILLPSKLMIFGGEALQSDLVKKITSAVPDCRVVNHYGPTETTIGKLLHEVKAGNSYNKTIPVGRPFSNSSVYVLSKENQLCPFGIAGELHVAGDGLARGYLNNKDLTEEKFVPVSIAGKTETMYRTGDLVRLLADGNIEFIGRVDNQVKIRGYRVELGEIESIVMQSGVVQQAVVLAREDKDGNKNLVAYVMGGERFDKETMISFLRERLPDYMVPAVWMILESFPLLPNGKINRKGLPEPDASEQLADQYQAASNEIESRLVAIWQDVLEVDQVGVNDDFFELGGHSLLAVRLVSVIRKEFAVEMPIGDIFDYPTVKKLAAQLNQVPGEQVVASITRNTVRPEHIPLSFSQERLWFIDQLEGSVQYHVPAVLRVKGKLNIKALEHSLKTIVNRHEVLRTVYLQDEGRAYQVIKSSDNWALTVVDGSEVIQDDVAFRKYFQQIINEPFDLTKDYTLRAHLVAVNETENIVIVTIHHIASDAWSRSILVKEVVELYHSYSKGLEVTLPSLPIQYADFAIWQRDYLKGDVLERNLAYWRTKLTETTPLQLPTDYPRPSIWSNRGASLNFEVERGLTEKLRLFSQQEGTTLFMTLVSAFNVLLYRYTGQSDICVGTAVAGRQLHEVEHLIGFFINTLALRCEVRQNAPFTDLLQQVKQTTIEAYEHQGLPFEKVVEAVVKERDLSRSPLTQVQFVLRNTPDHPELRLGDTVMEVEEYEQTVSKLDITFYITESESGLTGSVEYATDLYRADTILRMVDHYKVLLSSIIDNPQRIVGEMPLLTKLEDRQLLVDFAGEKVDYPNNKTIVDLFEEQSSKTPQAIAVVFGDQQLTYQQLSEKTNQLAHYIISKGFQPEMLVPLCIERSIEMILGILGILKAGGAYVPIDPEYPQDRIQYMLEDTGATVILTNAESRAKLEGSQSFEIISLDEDWRLISKLPVENPNVTITPNQLAYVIYTSGSTGKPKGAMNEHAGVVNRLCWAQDYFKLTGVDSVLQKTSFSFDVSVWELLWPLLVGARLVFARPGGHRDNEYLKSVIEESNVTMLHFVPSMLGAFLPDLQPGDCKALRKVLCSGEELKLSHVELFKEKLPHAELHNLYGPTEAAIDVTYWTFPESGDVDMVPIGRPVSNTQIYILDKQLSRVPIGVPGEIYIGGIQVGRGYLNRPELTAEKFIPNFLNGDSTSRLYRTGDLARWMPDGNIEYLGRIDEQVKIRGFRIELGEIEALLHQSDLVKQAVVLAKDDKEGNKRLVGYIVPQREFDRKSIISHLKGMLPDYMIPALWVVLEQLPLTPTGKLDKRALPDPDADELLKNEYVAPRNETQAILVEMWQDMLGVKQVGVYDNFFELGGHSLMVIKMVANIKKQFSLSIPISSLFQFTCINDLGNYLEREIHSVKEEENEKGELQLKFSKGVQIEPELLQDLKDNKDLIPSFLTDDKFKSKKVDAFESELKKIDRDSIPDIPLSFSQERLWFIHQLEGSLQYHLPIVLRLKGRLNQDALRYAFKNIVNRHEVLRTVYRERDGQAWQVIKEKDEFSLDFINGSQYQSDHRGLTQLLERLTQVPFDLSNDHMVRASLICLNEHEHILTVTMHHIASDGWSLSIIVNEVAELFASFTENRQSRLDPLPIQYADYAIWQRKFVQGNLLEKKCNYWKEKLSGATPLQIPIDYPRPPVQSTRGASVFFHIGKDVTRALSEFSHRQEATLFMTLLSAFKILLYRYSGQQDICVGIPIAGRQYPEVEGLIGFFINTLVLRTNVEGGLSLKDLLKNVKTTAIQAYENQEVPVEKIVELVVKDRDMSRNPLFQVLFSLQNTPEVPDLQLGDLTLSRYEIANTTSKLDISFYLSESTDGLHGSVEYCTDLFDRETIEQMIRHYTQLLSSIIETPDKKIDTLRMLPGTEEKHLLEYFNNTAESYARQKSIVHLIEEQAEKNSNGIAIIFKNRQLTYRELNERSNQLAHYLRKAGVEDGRIVPICIERGPDMIVGLLAVMKAGAAYSPIDPEYPTERINYMVADTGASIVITSNAAATKLKDQRNILPIEIDSEWSQISNEPKENLPTKPRSTSLAYVIYTSGSTGKPKGVMIEHRSVINLLTSISNQVVFGPDSSFLSVTTFSFDICYLEFFMPLIFGGKLVIVSREVARDGFELSESISHHRPSHMQGTPSTWQLLLDAEWKNAEGMIMLVGGEAVKESLKDELVSLGDVYNVYGPTETTIWSTSTRLTADQKVVIGKPLANTAIYIVSEGKQLCPPKVAGEICIGGDGLARGYLNRPELTAEKFISHPFSGEPGARIYRTGDLGRWLPDGNIEYLGRFDDQVKIRGYRIELGEIETVLMQGKLCKEAVVVAKEDRSGTKRLVAYIVPDKSFDHEAMTRYLEDKLPEFMIPSLWVEMESMPLTANGKINRKALPAPDTFELSRNEYVAPRTTIEISLANIWRESLDLSNPGIHDNFFQLGGHSLLAMRVVSSIRQQLKIEVGIRDFFLHPTIASLSYHLQTQNQSELLPSVEVQRRPEFIPLSFSQERLWFIDRLEGSVSYHIPVVLRLKGELNLQALSNAFRDLLQRHEVLRTVISENEDQAYQVINTVERWKLSVAEDAAYHKKPEAVRDYIHHFISEPFDLSNDYMLRAALIRLDTDDNILVLTIHHIAADGWSMPVIVQEISELYMANVQGRESKLEPLKVQFADYAIWQRRHLTEAVVKKKLEYWKQNLDGVSPLQLPTDYKRPVVQSTEGHLETFVIETEIARALQKLSNEQGTTLYMTLLAAFNVLLYRYSGQHDICVGSPIANRTRQEFEGLVGFFVNSIALRNNITSQQSFLGLLQQVKRTTLEAYEHQDLPFEKVVEVVVKERDMSRSPIFQVMFVLQNTPNIPALDLGGLSLSAFDHQHSVSKFDLSFFISETTNGLEGSVEYATHLFHRSTIIRMMEHFKLLLASIVMAPGQAVGRLQMLTFEEEVRLTRKFNDTALPYSSDKTLVDLFVESVGRNPNAVAVVCGNEKITYRQLDETSNQLAHYLQSKGIGAETVVPICIGRSVQMIVGILGILKAGAAYLPVDPEYPEDRINYMLSDANASVFVSNKETISQLAEIGNVQIIDLDAEWPVIMNQPAKSPGRIITQNQLAYIIYTSGSTGKPKGVMIEHGNVYSFLCWCRQEFSSSHFEIGYASTSICFDLSVFEIFYPLTEGKCIRLLKNGLQIGKYLPEEESVMVNTVPSVVESLLQQKVDLSNVTVLNMAGEPIPLYVQRSLNVERMEVRNLYGPSENTTYSTVFRLKKGEPALIGKPISNTQVFILNDSSSLQPVGIIGEIYIGGAGVARGYLNQVELTTAKFISNPFEQKEGSKLYKTGDLGRWLPDGDIEYLGRLDDQVKIRGYRIELGEIETVLQEGEMVQQAVVVVKEDLAGDKRLVAYIVPKEKFDRDSVVGFLKNKLPEYMIPSLWVELKQLPLTPNGKVDKKSLPDPDITSLQAVEYVAPRNKVEEILAGIWQDLLNFPRIGIFENFFNLGGHSLLAMRVVTHIRRELAIELPIKQIFLSPTIAELAAYLEEESTASTLPAITSQRRPARIPLSFSQERLWFIDQLEGTAPYHLPAILRLKGDLNTDALQYSLQTIANRHEVLRTVYLQKDGEPYQFIKEKDGLVLTHIDGTMHRHNNVALQRMIDSLIRKPFDLSNDDMLRATLISVDDDEQILVVTMHHIASDAWSMSIIVKEVIELYDSFSEGRKPNLPDPEFQYADYALWQRNYLRGEELERKVVYWKEKLRGVSTLELPTDYKRPLTSEGSGASIRFRIEKKLYAELQNLSRQMGSSSFMTLLSAFKILLHRYTGQEDISVGTSIASRQQKEVENLVGFFVNTLALRTEVNDALSFSDFLQQVRSTTLEAYAHQEVPFEKVVDAAVSDRDMSRSPLFQVMLVSQNTPDIPQLKFGDVSLSYEVYQGNISKFDITYFVNEVDEELQVTVEYRSDLFREDTMVRMAKHFRQLLSSIVRTPNQKIGSLLMLEDAEKQHLLSQNHIHVSYPEDQSIVTLFEKQVEKAGTGIALVFEDERLSYLELNSRANQLAHYLRSRGIKKDSLVPLCIERSTSMIIGMLGILKAGAAYVPIEPDFPEERKMFVIEDSQSTIVVSSADSSSSLPYLDNVQVLEIDDHFSGVRSQPTSNPNTGLHSQHLAYVIYTSGSTGRPKGVMIEHGNLLDYVFGLSQAIGIDECKSFACVSSIATDLGNTVIFPSLVFGGTLHLFSRESVTNAQYLQEYFRMHGVECLKIVPSHWRALSFEGQHLLPTKLLIFGGEALSFELVDRLHSSGAGCRIVNHYGPTETTIGKLLHEVQINRNYKNTIPIGKPFSNTQVYVMSDQLDLCPIGVPGELFIGGKGVARGYLNNSELTREKFVPNPFSDGAGPLLYKTGDLVRYLEDGSIEFIGRVDDQVKIRGYRVELGEIVDAILKTGQVDQAVVLAKEGVDGNKRLVCYLVPGLDYDKERLLTLLKETLPEYMIPANWVELQNFPMLPNGKVDRKALPDPDGEVLKDQYTAPTNDTESRLAAIWQDVLEMDQVGINDDFFELGGHSLLAVRLISAIRKEFTVEMPIGDVFDYPTVKLLASQLSHATHSEPLDSIRPATPRPERIPLSFSQERLWFIDQLEGSVQYHVPAVLRLNGSLNKDALSHALETIVDRHESLRTVFLEDDGKPYQFVKPEGEWKLVELDGRRYPHDQAALQADLKEIINQPFDLTKDYMIRAHLLNLNEQEHILVVNLHHIASDGWSRSILVREVVELYSSFIEHRKPQLVELPVQYADYALWQRQNIQGDVLEEKLSYWKNKLENVEVLRLPTDYPRPAVLSTRGAGVGSFIEQELAEKIKNLSQQSGTTLFMTLLATFKVLLYRYSHQQDICVGSPIAGRQQHELEPLIGFFVNTLALRSELKGDLSFSDLLQQVKTTTLEAFEHQEVSFEKVVDEVVKERDLSRSPLTQVQFVLRNTPEIPALEFGELKLSAEAHERTTTQFDITFFITETSRGFHVFAEYSTDLYTRPTVEKMMLHFEQLLNSIVSSPGEKIAKLEMLTTAEEQQLLLEFNDTISDYPTHKTVIDLFQDRVNSVPGNLALAFLDKELSYRQLDEQSNQLAHYLLDRGVKGETLVPVCIGRGIEMIVAILGILKAGGAYVPIDPEYPLQRIQFILQDTNAKLLICSQETASLMSSASSVETIVLDQAVLSLGSTENIKTHISPGHLAYVIYTSGSTGTPKGVMIEHGSLVNYLVNDQTRYIDNDTSNAGSFIHLSYTFDASLTAMFMPLIAGKPVIIGSNQSFEVFDDENLWKYAPYDFLKITPSHLQLLHPTLNERPGEWLTKKLVVGGEALHLSQFDEFIAQEVSVEVVNEYGPTEATVGCSTYSFNPHVDNRIYKNEISIGKPIRNVQLYILDDDSQLVPIGVVGEICIGGLGVARGYLNRPELTAEKFIPEPFRSDERAKLYKTGDLARWMPDGNIEYLGRKDDQVKIRGYRIELGEVESTLNELEPVNISCVVAKKDGDTHRLTSYYVPQVESVKSKERELYLNRVASWKELYEAEYGQTEEDANVDPEFNIIGWNDSFTGGAIPAEQMKEWLHDIVQVIMQDHPENVLEIGCGTGLIYYQLAGKVKKYIGADLSRSSIKQILNHINKKKREYGITELQTAPAHEVTLPENETVDTIILNSIVQYFPGEEYLNDVIRKSISLLNGKGRIILGDVRDNRLLRQFKARLQMHKLQDSANLKEFNWVVDQDLLKEEELCIAPDYFYNLQAVYPEISHVDIQLKQGVSVNELTLYRYNVVLYLGKTIGISKPSWQDWRRKEIRETTLKQIQNRTATVALKDVPNYRLWKEKLFSGFLENTKVSTVGDLKQYTEIMDEETLEVLKLLEIAQQNGYRYRLLLDENPLHVNILFELDDQGTELVEQPYYETRRFGDIDFTNIPLFNDISLVLQKEIRSLLQQRLPEYMVPQDFIALSGLPLTGNGKIDRLFLGQREERAIANRLNFEPPATEVEQKLAVIWQELLGLERVGVMDNFFELGGHSLMAMRVISAIRKQMGVELAIKELFNLTTIRALGKYIEIQTKIFSEEATSSEYELINI